MASSKCPHCNGRFFELVRQEPTGAAYAIQFIQCSSCGAPVGTMEFYNSGALIKEQAKRIDDLERKLDGVLNLAGHVDHVVVAIANAMNRR